MTRHQVDQTLKYARRARVTSGLRTRLIAATPGAGFGLALRWGGRHLETTDPDAASAFLREASNARHQLYRGDRYSNPNRIQGAGG